MRQRENAQVTASLNGIDMENLQRVGRRQQLTKRLLESALRGEITGHLGCDKHDPAGKNSGNSRNGTRAKALLTDVGPVGAVCPGMRSTWSRSAPNAPADHAAATPGHPRGRGSAEHEPLSRSRPGNRSTMRTRCTARTSRNRADGSGTGTSGQVFHRPHKTACPCRRPSPRSRLEPVSPLVGCSSHCHAEHSSP